MHAMNLDHSKNKKQQELKDQNKQIIAKTFKRKKKGVRLNCTKFSHRNAPLQKQKRKLSSNETEGRRSI